MRLYQIQLLGTGDSLGAVMDLKLTVNVASMDLDRAHRDEKPVSDLTVGQPLGYEAKNLALSLAE
jgi:hypothetical protein